ncbi:MAG: GatB/YqeY domain-containing protein [Actinobacteria bacterium]|nr:GatB/YqeY domain-containing protein [Actinomycetota bacterium]MBU1943557.1 GatB/YqeY domain-containing protein [Actinomycetota bacterium]MBU2687566.1 GatB/YqeY domain-containing protein [Actinomycetota bacterium]
MDLKAQVGEDLKTAMKSRDKLKVSTLRLLLSEIKNAEIAKRGELDESETDAVVAREARKRREAIEEFAKAGRQDLVDKETAELEILSGFLPEQVPEDELRGLIDQAIEEVGAASPKDLGKVMSVLMPRVKGKADGKAVNRLVREALGG